MSKEHRLVHRWYGNVPGENPNMRPGSGLVAEVSQSEKKIEELQRDLEKCERQLVELDLEMTGIPSHRNDRTDDDNEALSDIEADYSIIEKKIQVIKEQQSFYGSLMNRFTLD